jgi:CubicO group peptidase (beta-lactamase class C family)
MRNVDDHWFADPEPLGLDPSKIEALLVRVRRDTDSGLLPAAQVAIARHGKLAVYESFGDANAESLFGVFSATKAIVAAAAWLLMQDGRLDESERVAEIIPEFAGNGKGEIRVAQLLLHTAGFPAAPFRPWDWNDLGSRLNRFASWRADWDPGTRFVYHPTSSMWVVAEIIERRSGLSCQQFIREQIAQPLDLPDLYVGLPDSQNARVLPCVHVGEAATTQELAAVGLPPPRVTEVTEEAISLFNEPAVRCIGVPGGGGIMGAAELALFYQGLLHGGPLRGGGGRSHDDSEIWRDTTLANARRVRTGELQNPDIGKAASRGLGIVVAGDEFRNFRGFGKTNSAETFGHNGAGGQLAWADPVTGLSLGYCTNGHDRNLVRRGRRMSSAS